MADRLAVDLSSFTAVPTAAQVACMRDKGVELAIIGTRGNRTRFARQAQAFLDGGVAVDAYLYLYWREPGAQQGDWCLETIGAVPVGTIWPDVEFDDQNPNPGTPTVAACLADAYAHLDARASGLYTSATMWDEAGLGTAYADKKLWRADYGALPRRWRPFGGWSAPVLTQFAGTVRVCPDDDPAGLNVDLNVIEAPVAAPGVDEMWHRLNARAPWWDNRVLTSGGTMQLAVDFPALPPGAAAVDLEVFLDPGSDGRIVFMDGDGSYAGQVSPLRREAVIRVVPLSRTCKFTIEGTPKTALVGVVGYLS